jgi:hypothetical protein
MEKRAMLFILIAVLSLSLVTDARAYIDPGVGSILLQSIIGAFAVGAAFVAGFWGNMKSFFVRGESKTDSKGNQSECSGEDASQK